MLSLNPYIAGNPVGGTPNFVGRADVLREVLRVMRQPHQNIIVLYGQRRIGKTSVLLQLAAELPTEGTYYPVYFDLQDKASWSLGRVLTALARALSHELARQGPPELRGTGPLLNHEEPIRAFQETWLPDLLQRLPEGHSIVLLFDEFDVLADPQGGQAGADLFPYLRGLLSTDPARLQFAFVIGRKVEDLESIALSLFKGAPALRVSLLNKADTFELVRLSERNQTLRWSEDALEKVWDVTHGHPFLTQQLCSRLWENLYDRDPTGTPTVVPEDVERAIPETLEASRNTLEWLWDGLPPAERVVISALAGAGDHAISPPQLEQLLRESGVRVVIRELQNAPQLLQDWDLIEPSEGGFRFRVELFRQWILAHKPLSRVQEELDRIEPLAENLYQAAYGFFRNNQLEDAMPLLRQAIGLNPNHIRSRQLLAEIFLLRGEVDQAVQILQLLYDTLPAIARPRLVQALLLKAEDEPDEEKRLPIYQQILLVDPQHPITLQRVQELQLAARQRELAKRRAEIEKAEAEKRYREALELTRQLAKKYPDEPNWPSELARLEREAKLADEYQRALGALNSGDKDAALRGLAEVIAQEPNYEEAARYLYLTQTGQDPASLISQVTGEQKAHSRARARLDDEILARAEAEKQRQELQIYLENEKQQSLAQQRLARRNLLWAIGGSILTVGFFIAWLLTRTVNITSLNVTLTAIADDYTAMAQMQTEMAEEMSTPSAITRLPSETPPRMETEAPSETPALADPPPTPSLTPPASPALTPNPTPDPYAGVPLNATEARLRLGKGQLLDAALSPDGAFVALASTTGIYVYEAATFELLWGVATASQALSIAISNEGLLAAGVGFGEVVLRGAQDGTDLEPLTGHESGVSAVAFSPDGFFLATGAADGEIILWNVQDHELISRWPGHAHGVTTLAFSQNSQTLASGADDDSVVVWNLDDPQNPAGLEPYATRATVWSLAWSANDVLAWGMDDGGVEIWAFDPFDSPVSLPGHDSSVRSVTWAPDGQLVSAADDGDILFWDPDVREATRALPGEGLPLLALLWDANEELITATREGLQRRNPQTGEPTQTLVGFTAPVNSLAFSPDGAKLVSGDEDGIVRVWDVASGGQFHAFAEHTSAITSVAFASDGVTVASASRDNKIIFWNTHTGERTGTITYDAPILSVVFSPGNANLLAFSASDASIILWDRETETSQSLIGHQAAVITLAFSSDGSALASGSEGGTVMIWDIGTLTPLKVLNSDKQGHTATVYSVAFSPQDTLLASGSGDEKVILWVVASGEQLGFVNNLNTAIWAVDFSPERGLLAAGSPNATVYVWLVSALSMAPVELHGHTAEITSLAFSPNTETLASASQDGTLVLWNAANITP